MLAKKLVDQPGGHSTTRIVIINWRFAIVEVVSGRPYRKFVRDRFVGPAGLQDTGFAGDAGARLVAPASGQIPARLYQRHVGVGEGVYSRLTTFFDGNGTSRRFAFFRVPA